MSPDLKLQFQTVEVGEHLQFIQTALLCEHYSECSPQFLAKTKLMLSLTNLSENLPNSTLAELELFLKVSTVFYRKYRKQFPFMHSPIRAVKTTCEIYIGLSATT